mmetsp:Transcript_20774/g.44308  ORF Transcript_20774/g.44308 Transcript_20774/m.44308 type:complete len:204 (-) Transcript_20774:911-1522(-)
MVTAIAIAATSTAEVVPQGEGEQRFLHLAHPVHDPLPLGAVPALIARDTPAGHDQDPELRRAVWIRSCLRGPPRHLAAKGHDPQLAVAVRAFALSHHLGNRRDGLGWEIRHEQATGVEAPTGALCAEALHAAVIGLRPQAIQHRMALPVLVEEFLARRWSSHPDQPFEHRAATRQHEEARGLARSLLECLAEACNQLLPTRQT